MAESESMLRIGRRTGSSPPSGVPGPARSGDIPPQVQQLSVQFPGGFRIRAGSTVWTNNPVQDKWGLTIERIEEDVARLKDAEAAYEAEAAKEYTFTPAPREESLTDRESELAEQIA